LVTTQNDQVRLLLIKDTADKVKSTGIRLTLAAVVCVWNGLTALANTSTKMQITDLHDLVSAVISNPGLGLLDLAMGTSAHGQLHARQATACVEEERRSSDSPAVSCLHGIISK
jgi:hypothetical protein